MKKILIISYFFPPCNLTASQRIFSWANDLYKHGIYPIIISRRWDHHISSLFDTSLPTGSDSIHEIKENYAVFYEPHNGNLRDLIYAKFGADRMVILRKMLTAIELLIQNILIITNPYRNFYRRACNILEENPDIDTLVISGNPFIQFRIGYALKRKFHRLKWIADYRDAWTTSEINAVEKGHWYKIVQWYDRFFEKLWVSSATLITSVSDPLASGIAKLVGRRYEVLYNGFDKEAFTSINGLSKYNVFTITYVGTLYEGQSIEIFCNGIRPLLENKLNIKILFPGLLLSPKQYERVANALKGYEDYFEATARISREETLKMEVRSHLLLYVAWKGYKGIVASKIYEYMASKTPILVVPGDGGAVDEIIKDSMSGVVLNASEEVHELLLSRYNDFCSGIISCNESSRYMKYSREYQTQKLAEIIKSL